MESSTTTLAFVVQLDDGRFLRDWSNHGWGPRYSKDTLEHAAMFPSEQKAQEECGEWLHNGGKIVRVRQQIQRTTYTISESSKALLRAVHEVNVAHGKEPPPVPAPAPKPRRHHDAESYRREEREWRRKEYNCKAGLTEKACKCMMCEADRLRHHYDTQADRREWENRQGPDYWRGRLKQEQDRQHMAYIDRLNNGDHDVDGWP